MKRILILTTALFVGLASSNSADAQYRPSERVVVQMKVDSWGPQEGEVGSLVTLNGSGFTRKMSILVGGRKVQPVKMGARAFSFRVPASYGDGQIVIRKSGVANDYVVGTFKVWADPRVDSFSPASGTPGTRVEIRGRNFSANDVVMLGNQRVRIDRWGENGHIVTIPEGAASGYLTVQNARNASSRSPRPFNVVAPAPYISNFSPLGGQPGTLVRINGGNYGNDIRVSYGRQSIPIVRSGAGWIEVAIPGNADRSWPLSVSSGRGTAASKVNFNLELAPSVSGYSTSWGTTGTRVALDGRHFLASDRVSIGGQDCKILQLRDNQITVEIPPNARSGVFAIHRGRQTIPANNRFEVVYTPQVSSIAPLEGAPGTRVSLKGQNLEGARVFIGNLEIRPSAARADQIDFVIPQGALSGKLRVRNRVGEGGWANPFTVWNFPSITQVSPNQGAIGSSVTISGSMLGNAERIFIGKREMPILSRNGMNSVTVKVPNGASTGAISWTAYGKLTPTRWSFNVLQAPVLQSYAPTEGGAGTAVTINGSGFDRNTRVRYGNQDLRVLSWRPNRLSVAIPSNARKSEYLSVEGPGGGSRASYPFGLLAAPTLRNYSSYRAKPGTEVTLWGTSLGQDTIVNIGGTNTRVLRLNKDNSIVVAVPALSSGSYEVSVQHQGLRSVGRKRFTVEGWAQVNDFRPGRAKIGDTIMLTGSGLTGARIWYGKHEMPIIKSDPRGRRLWVRVPDGCSGSSQLSVVDGANTNMSGATLEIEAPAAPPKVRDHRDEDEDTYKKPRRGKAPKVRDHRRRKGRR